MIKTGSLDRLNSLQTYAHHGKRLKAIGSLSLIQIVHECNAKDIDTKKVLYIEMTSDGFRLTLRKKSQDPAGNHDSQF